MVLWLTGLHLKAEAVGQRPAPRFGSLDQHGFPGRVAGGIHDRGVHLIKERKGVQITLRGGERVLVERIAGMYGDGPRHSLRARVFQARQKYVTDKGLRSFFNVEDDIDLAGIGGLGLLRHVHGRLIKAAAQVRCDQCIVVACQIAGRKHLARRGVQHRGQC